MTYTVTAFMRTSPRKLRLVEQREGLNAAQLGGAIAHLIEEVDTFVVTDETAGSVLRYDKRGGV